MERAVQKEFLYDSYKFSTRAQVLDQAASGDQFKIKLSNTVYHPQGGGQPNDIGNLVQGEKTFEVKSAEIDKADGLIWHLGKYTSDSHFEPNSEVEVVISEPTRRLNARLHSAGHLLDIAVQRLGYPLTPGKGYHFLEGSYVEYVGNVPDKDQALASINLECERIIAEAQDAVETQVLSFEEAQKAFEVPKYLAGQQEIRYVKLTAQDKGCPCGGTHVKQVKEIGKVVVHKIQKKGKNLRVSYAIE